MNTPTKGEFVQAWFGYVLEIGDETFTARLTDLNNREVEAEAEIYLVEVSDEDRTLLRPGAFFYWLIGLNKNGFLRFIRIPPFTNEDIDIAHLESKEVRKVLGMVEDG